MPRFALVTPPARPCPEVITMVPTLAIQVFLVAIMVHLLSRGNNLITILQGAKSHCRRRQGSQSATARRVIVQAGLASACRGWAAD